MAWTAVGQSDSTTLSLENVITQVQEHGSVDSFKLSHLGLSGTMLRDLWYTVRFTSVTLEQEFHAWNSQHILQHARIGAVAFMLFNIGIVATIWEQAMIFAPIHVFESILLFVMLLSCVMVLRSTMRFFVKHGIAIAACCASVACVLMAVLLTTACCLPDGLNDLSYIGFGVVITLVWYNAAALQVQVVPLLALLIVPYVVWLTALIVSEFAMPIILWAGIPVLVAMSAHSVHSSHVNRRFQYYLLLSMAHQMQVIQNGQDLLNEQRIAAAKATASKATHQAIMGYACHELRNPLHGLQGCLEELLVSCDLGHVVNADDRWNLNSMVASVSQMSRVTDDVLDLNKLQAGKLQVASIGVNLRNVIERVAVQYNGSQASQIRLEVDSDVPDIVVTDPLRVAQILTNGVTNALKHTLHGQPIVIKCYARSTRIHFEVLNMGSGLGGMDGGKLFELYERGADETRATIKGVGLGLPICKLLIQLLGGEIGLEDRLTMPGFNPGSSGTVTAFWFHIPLDAVTTRSSGNVATLVPGGLTHAPSDVSSQGEPMVNASTDSTAMPFSSVMYWGKEVARDNPNVPLSILVVDDEIINRRLLVRMLQRLGCQTFELSDGDEIRGFLDQGHAVDVCLLDIHMIRTNGCEVLSELRQQDVFFTFIATTGNCATSDVKTYRHAGFDGMLGKPFTKDALGKLLGDIFPSYSIV